MGAGIQTVLLEEQQVLLTTEQALLYPLTIHFLEAESRHMPLLQKLLMAAYRMGKVLYHLHI